MDVLLALKDAIETDARMDAASKKRKWIDFLVLARKDFYNRWVKEDVHQALFVVLPDTRRSSCSTNISTRSRPRSTTARSRTRSPARSASPTSASCARSRRRSRSPSPASCRSARKSCARRWCAFKRGEKFTLDNHARLHDAIEQYLFEQRRDVLRLVTSTRAARRGRRAEDLGGGEAADRRVRLRRAQRQRSAQLRHHAAGAGIASRSQERRMDEVVRLHRTPGSRPPVVRPLLARRARLAAPQRQGARGGAGEAARADRRQRPDAARRQHRAGAGPVPRARALPPARRAASSRAPAKATASPATCSQPARDGEARQGRRRQRRRRLQFVLELKIDDIVDWLWEELKLPNLKVKRGAMRQDELHARRLEQARRALAPRPAAHR